MESKTLKINHLGDLCYISFPSFEQTGLVAAAYSTRLGGVSAGEFSTMNFSFTRGDRDECVRENYRILCGALGLDYRRCALSHQTHTVNIRAVTEEDAGKGIFRPRDYDDIDALVTDCKKLPLVTQFADCVPVLLLDPKRPAIGAAHASWRGTRGRIAEMTLCKMAELYGTDPADVIACIAPSIGPCCYEIGEDVYAEFLNLPGVNIERITTRRGDKYMLDLWEANRIMLENCGVRPENITVTDLCTRCHPDVFHSHRAAGERRGNNAAIIALL